MIDAGGRLVTTVLAVVVATSTLACQRAARSPRSSGASGLVADKSVAEPPPAQELAARMAAKAPAAPAAAGAAGPGTGPVQAMVAARKLIRTGQLTVEVASYARAADEVSRMAERYGGYVSDTRSSQDDRDAQQGTITLRVPAERFAVVMTELKKLGRTRNESVGTQDVTKAYADLETRLRVKRETVERLREILRGRTAKLSDVLEVERELARLTEEIEQLEGERRYYDNQLSLSTITLALQEPQAVVHGGFFDPIRQAFRDSLDVLAGSVAALVYAVAVLIPWVIVIWPLWRIVRAARARRKAARAAPTAA